MIRPIDTGSPTPDKDDRYREADEWDMHKCFHPYTWWGENIGKYNGTIKTSLNKCGRARLNFGNCYIDTNKKNTPALRSSQAEQCRNWTSPSWNSQQNDRI